MGVGGQRHAPAVLSPGKTRYPLYRRLIRSYIGTNTAHSKAAICFRIIADTEILVLGKSLWCQGFTGVRQQKSSCQVPHWDTLYSLYVWSRTLG